MGGRFPALVVAVLALVALGWAEEQVSISVQLDPPGAGFVSGEGLYPPGATVVLEAEPAPGFRFVAWEDEGVVVGTSLLFQFIAESDRLLIAHFEEVPGLPELGGSWEAQFSLLPAPGLESSQLELRTRRELFGMKGALSAVAGFSASAWRSLSFKATLTGGGLSLSGGLTLDPVSPGYESSYLGLTGSWAGLRWSLRVNHSAFGGVPPGPHLLYTLNVYLSPFSFTVRGEEGTDGLQFKDLLARITEVPLISQCLGIRARGSLSLTKEDGFSYADLQLSNLIRLCCGISLNPRVKFTPQSKELSLAPHWSRLIGCLSLYGDIDWDEEAFSFDGFILHGYRVRCCLCGSCPGAKVSGPYLEFVTALDPSHVPGGFRGEEFEYWKLGACGPACCGGYWTLESVVYFSHPGALFRLSRLVITGAFPLSPGSVWEWETELDLLSGTHSLEMSWRWEF